MSKQFLRVFLLTAMTLLHFGALGDENTEADGWTLPTKEALVSIVEAPETIRTYLDGVTVNQAAAIMIAAVDVMETANMSDEAITAVLNAMLNQTTLARGEAFGARVMVILRKKVNPRLLPVIPTGTAPSGGGRRYSRQSSP